MWRSYCAMLWTRSSRTRPSRRPRSTDMLVTLPVRKAVKADEPAILDLCKENHAENGQFSLAMPKVEGMVQRAFGGGGAIIGITGSPGRVEGAILLLITQFWYTED